MIVQFWKRDAFSVAVKLFILLLVSHVCILRVCMHNQNLEVSAARFSSTSSPYQFATRQINVPLARFGTHMEKSFMPGHSYEFVQLDVFTQTPLAGNPLAIFTDARGLNDGEMQALAREMNLSETTFVLPGDDATEAREGKKVRIFTVEQELPFAGHPTLGTALYLYASESKNPAEINLDLKAGKIPVRFTANSENAGRQRMDGQ